MRTSTPPFFAVATLLLHAVALPAQESVTLDFDWPAGSSAQVTVFTTTSSTVMGQPNTMQVGVSYRMDVQEVAEGLRLSYSDYSMDGVPMAELTQGGEQGELSQVLSTTQPDVLVTRDGAFVGLVDYAALRTSLEELMASERASMEAQGMGDVFDEVMAATLSEESMSTAAELYWNQLVGFWAGRTMEVGEVVTVPSQMAFPMITNLPVELQTELQVAGEIDCPDDAVATRCLALNSVSMPDGATLRNLMDVFVAEMSERAGGMSMGLDVSDMTVELRSTLVVDGATLQPLQMETRAGTVMVLEVMGESQTMDNTQTVVTLYDWSS